jgi:hypothetical protein
MHGGVGVCNDGIDGIGIVAAVGGIDCDENRDWAMVGLWKNLIGCRIDPKIISKKFVTKIHTRMWRDSEPDPQSQIAHTTSYVGRQVVVFHTQHTTARPFKTDRERVSDEAEFFVVHVKRLVWSGDLDSPISVSFQAASEHVLEELSGQ